MKSFNDGHPWFAALAAGVLLLVSAGSIRAMDDYIVDRFDTGVPTQWWATWWGNGAITWDGSEDADGNPNSGSALMSGNTIVNQNTYVIARSFGRWAWDSAIIVDVSQYTNLQLYLKWDKDNSSMPLSTYNTSGDRLRVGFMPQSRAWGGGAIVYLDAATIPEAASNNWVQINIPINQNLAGLNEACALVFKRWDPAANNGLTVRFWVDNIKLQAPVAPPPPPTVRLAPATPGLQMMSTPTGGNNRYSIRTTNPDYSWVDATSPVTYAITIKQYPNFPAYPYFQTHWFLVPASGLPWGPGDTAVDWNSTNLIFFHVQSNPDGSGYARFMWRTNGTGWGQGSNQVWNRTNPPIPAISSSTILGKWSLTFSQNTNITLTAPDSSSTNFALPSEAVDYFRDPVGMYAYAGMQPNRTENVGQASIFARIEIKGGVNAELDDTFPGPALASHWTKVAADPNGIQIVPDGMPYWLSWTLPDSGFSPIWSPVLGAGANWTDPGLGAPISVGDRKVLVPASLSTSNAFFQLIKREYTKLQVLMPGETAAPGTATGKTGTPTPQQVAVPFNITVNAVDANWFPVQGVNNTVSISSTDPYAYLPVNAPLVNGTATFQVVFGSEGTWTVTASDVTDPTKTPGTSSPTLVNP